MGFITESALAFEAQTWQMIKDEFGASLMRKKQSELQHSTRAKIKSIVSNDSNDDVLQSYKIQIDIFLNNNSSPQRAQNACTQLEAVAQNTYGTDDPNVQKVMRGIEGFIKIGDQVATHGPESVGFAWAAFTYIFGAIKDDFDTCTLLGGTSASMIGLMLQCRIFGKMFDNQKGLTKDTEAQDKVRDCIREAYRGILDFSWTVTAFFAKPKVLRMATALIRSSTIKFKDLIDQIQGLDTNLTHFADTAFKTDMVEGQQELLEQVRGVRQDIMASQEHLLGALDKLSQDIASQVSKLLKPKNNFDIAREEYRENLKRLGPGSLPITLRDDILRQGKVDGTCEWIFTSTTAYTDWEQSLSPTAPLEDLKKRLLWLQGEEGTGKTILLASITERVQKIFKDANNVITHFVFCDSGVPDTQRTDNILMNLISNLYQRCQIAENIEENSSESREVLERLNSANTILQNIFKSPKVGAFSARTLCKAYSDLIDLLSLRVYLIIDALEECKDSIRGEPESVLQAMLKTIQSKDCNLSVLVSSQLLLTEINDSLEGYPRILIEEENRGDIGLVVKDAVTNRLASVQGWSPAEQEDVCVAICEKAEWLFSYVPVAVNFLKSPFTRPFPKWSEKLPKGLEESYLYNFRRTDPRFRDLLEFALRWTILGNPQSDFTVDEIMEAFNFTYLEPGSENIDPQSLKSIDNTLLRTAGPTFFQFYDENPTKVRVRTTGISNYFRRRKPNATSIATATAVNSTPRSPDQNKADESGEWHFDEGRGHLEIAKRCLQHLLSPLFQRRFLQKQKFYDETLPVEVAQPAPDFGTKAPEEISEQEEEPRIDRKPQLEEEPQSDEPLKAKETQEDEVERKTEEQKDIENKGEQVSSQSAPAELIDQNVAEVRTEQGTDADYVEGKESKSNEPDVEVSANSIVLPEISTDEVEEDSEDEVDEQSPAADFETQQDDPPVIGERIRYEINYWPYHLRMLDMLLPNETNVSQTEMKGLWELVDKFLFESPQAYDAWQTQFNTDTRPLHWAALLGLVGLAERLILVRKEDVNQVDRNGQTPLHMAFESSSTDANTQMVKLLLQHGADPNIVAKNGMTAFQSCLRFNPPLQAVETFFSSLNEGFAIDPFKLNEENLCAFHYFAERGTDPAILLCLRGISRASIDVKGGDYKGKTPLQELVSRDEIPLELLRAFINAGADVNIEDNFSERPLSLVAKNGNVEAGLVLLDAGAVIDDPDYLGQTALHFVTNHIEFMKLLVEYPHDDCSFLNLTDDYQRTPLMWACNEDDEECALYLVDMLLKHDIPEINKVAFNGKTPLRKAALTGHRNVVERLLTLPTEDKDIDTEDFLFHRRALHAAAYRGHHEIVEMLVSAGSDVAKPDKDGNTPLMRCYQGWAAGDYTSSEDTLEFLIDKHSAAAIADKELMSLVAFKGSWRIMDQLLKLGANPNERDSHGWKPIQIVRRYKNSKEHAQMEYILDQYEAKFGKLPALWAKTKGITIDPQDKLQFHSDGFEFITVLTDHPVPAGLRKFYFEVEIKSLDENDSSNSGHSALAVGVGFSTKLARSTNRMPGWYTEEKGSRTWGFHGDDGCLYGYPNVYQKPFHDNLRFGYNDVIGCAWDTEEGTIQYTKNGGLLGIAFDGVWGRLFPAIGMGIEAKIITNLGADIMNKPFVWKDESLAEYNS